MNKKSMLYKLITLLMCSILTFGTPITVIAETEEVVECEIPDAEKFLEDDYDANLCWAATAVNMIWTSGYGAERNNPLTNEAFRNEDEVFDYFRQCFADESGEPKYAIEYFIEGVYRVNGNDGGSQLKNDAPEGKLVSGMDAVPKNSLKDYDQRYSEMDILEAAGNITGKAVGVWIRFWDEAENRFDDKAHWTILYDVVKDAANNIIGILLIDSDNDGVFLAKTDEEKAELSLLSNEAKAKCAKECPNTYTYYELGAYEVEEYG